MPKLSWRSRSIVLLAALVLAGCRGQPLPATAPPAAATPEASSTPTPTQEPAVTPGFGSSTITPTPALMIPGELGTRAIQGSVRVQQAGGPAPLGGATVTCYHHSYVRPSECPNAVTTAADGSFSFGEMYLHDTDRIDVSVAVAGYQPLTITRSGLEAFDNPIFDFVLSP